MKKLKIAIIGMAHIHATGLFQAFNRYAGEAEWLGIADAPPTSEELRQKRITRNFYMSGSERPPVFDDYKKLLAQKPDLAIVCTDIKDHAEITEELLAANINTLVEKPMAVSLEDGKKMYRAAMRSKASLAINWPIAWFPAFRKVKELADSGIVGRVLRVQYRSPSTRGPYKLGEYSNEELSQMWWYQHDRGGGSIIDYAGYGCVLSTWLNGGKLPKRVSGFKKNFFLPFADVEDYSVFTLEYEDSISIVEGSWSTMNNGEIPTGPVVYGSEGVIVGDRFNPQVKVYKDLKPHQPSSAPTAVFETKPISDNVGRNVIDHLLYGKQLYEMLTPNFNIRAMAALDAGIRSAESGRIEYVNDPFGV